MSMYKVGMVLQQRYMVLSRSHREEGLDLMYQGIILEKVEYFFTLVLY